MLRAGVTDAASIWSSGTYERIAKRFAPVQDELVERLEPRPGVRWLDLATGTGEVAVRAARAGATVSAIDITPLLLETAKERAAAQGLDIRFDCCDVELLPYEEERFDVVSSNFGMIFAPDHAAVAEEVARVTEPGARLGFTAWKPNPKLGELYGRFTDEPIAGREAYEWGDPEHVHDMLGDDFELEIEDRVFHVEADSGEEVWELFSSSAPPVRVLAERLDAERREEFHNAFVELFESYRQDDGIRAPRPYLLVLGTRR
jgi:SAM-dependent methyltransferase